MFHRGFLPALRAAIDRLAPAVGRRPAVPMFDLGLVDDALARLRVTNGEFGVGYDAVPDAVSKVIGAMPAIVAELREMRARGPRSTKLEDAVERDQLRAQVANLTRQHCAALVETDNWRRDAKGIRATAAALVTTWRQGSAAGDDRTAADCADELEACLAGGGR